MDSGMHRTKSVNSSHMNGEETERETPEPASEMYVAGALKGEYLMNAEEVASTDGISSLRTVMEMSENEGTRAHICRKGRPPVHDKKVLAPLEDLPESALQPKEIVDASVTTDCFKSKLHYLSDVNSGIESLGQSFPCSDSVEKIESEAGNAENGDSSTRDGMTLPDDNKSDSDSITPGEQGECERAENALESTEADDKDEDETEWPSEVFHMYMLGKICRICAEMTVVFDGPRKGVPKMEMVRYVKKIWKVDLSEEDSNRYPVNVCVHCERKIKRLYLKVSKKKKCEMFRTEPASFEPHKDQDCPVCMLRDADVEAQTLQSEAEEKGKKSPDDTSEAKAASEPRRNPARKRGWPDQGPPYRSIGCQTGWETFQDVATGLEEHDYTQDDALEQYLVLPKKLSGRTPYHKQPLCAVNAKYIRQGRLKPLISHIDRYCQSHKENKVETMFFLLMQALRDVGDRSRENAIVDIWTRKGSVGTSLTGEECLAKRILLKQTKDQYRKEYRYYKEKLDKPVLKPPLIVDRLEKTYFPEHLEYYITDGETGPVIYQHEKQNDPSYFALHESVESNKVDGVMGVRWRYFDAVAKTLEELMYSLDPFVPELNENACIQIDLSDYCEEKKDMTYLTDKNDAGLDSKRQQGKMITYLFCVQSLQAITEQTVKWMPSQDVSICRPLMKALVTDGSALRSSLLMIEEERNKMAGKYFHVTSQNGTPLRFVVFFSNDAPEVRRDYRNLTGLSMSSFKKAPTVISRYGNLCQELKRSWLASSPRLSHVGRVTNSRTKCRRCGEHGHNVRKCSKPSLDNMDGSKGVQHKRQKKLRAVPVEAFTVSPSNMGPVPVGAQPHHVPLQEQSLQQLKQEQQESLAQMTSVPANINQNNSAAIRSEDQLLWTCPGITNAPQNSSHQSQNTQVLIPCSNSEFQSVPHRTLIQGSQGASPPVYVWTYAVVQPQTGSIVQQQQPVSHQLSSIHQQPAQQQHQMTVIHQQPGQQQLQPLSVIHQQALSVGREHEPRGPSHDVQQLSIIHQGNNGLQAVETSQQQLTMGHQSASAQQQQSHQMSLVHQQQVSQTAVNIVQQVSQPQSHLHHPETSSPHEQVPHTQSSDLQPIIGQW